MMNVYICGMLGVLGIVAFVLYKLSRGMRSAELAELCIVYLCRCRMVISHAQRQGHLPSRNVLVDDQRTALLPSHSHKAEALNAQRLCSHSWRHGDREVVPLEESR